MLFVLRILVFLGGLCFWKFSVAQVQESAGTEVSVQQLLLQGVRAFRLEHHEEALALFQKVEQTGTRPDIGVYLGMALHKLGRHGEALAAYRAARRAGVLEPVAEYYDAVSCFRLGLLVRARRAFSQLLKNPTNGPTLGPRLREGAERFSQATEQLLLPYTDPIQRAVLSKRLFDAALTKVDQTLPQNEGLALEWLEEAAQQIPYLKPQDHAAAQTLFRQYLSKFPKVQQDRLSSPLASEVDSLKTPDKTSRQDFPTRLPDK